MLFEPLALPGAWQITAAPTRDARGSFTRLIDAGRYAEHGLPTQFAQHATSHNPLSGTLRGLHFQQAPHAEAKLVHCTRGALYDVMVDLRKTSATYLQHVAVTLTENTPVLLLIPAGCAHGFLTLAADTVIEYHISEPYVAEAQCGLRWNDPALQIAWPGAVNMISERDAAFPDWR